MREDKKVGTSDTVLGVVTQFRVFQQEARPQLRPVLLADPGEFKFLLSVSHRIIKKALQPRTGADLGAGFELRTDLSI